MATNVDDPTAGKAPRETRTSADTVPTVERSDWQLHRWQVSYRSGESWYPVGEYVALDGPAAVQQAIEVWGPGEDYRAEEIPWDAAPFSPNRSNRTN
jgi:hypothetical protein